MKRRGWRNGASRVSRGSVDARAFERAGSSWIFVRVLDFVAGAMWFSVCVCVCFVFWAGRTGHHCVFQLCLNPSCPVDGCGGLMLLFAHVFRPFAYAPWKNENIFQYISNEDRFPSKLTRYQKHVSANGSEGSIPKSSSHSKEQIKIEVAGETQGVHVKLRRPRRPQLLTLWGLAASGWRHLRWMCLGLHPGHQALGSLTRDSSV